MTATDYFAIIGYSVTAGAAVLALRCICRQLQALKLRDRLYAYLDERRAE